MTTADLIARARLDGEMRKVLARLELVSCGTITSYNASGGGVGENPDPRPKGCNGPAHLYWARLYGPPFAKTGGAKDDDERTRVIADADEDWQQLTGRGLAALVRPAGESLEERDARICDEGEGYTIKEAALKFRCGERDVRRARTNGGREQDLGKQIAPQSSLATAERQRRVREYREQGHSVTAISLLLKVGKATVSRDLRSAA